MRSRYRLLVGLALAGALIAAACSDDAGGETTTTASASADSTTTTAAPGTTTTALAATTTVAAPPLVVWAESSAVAAIEAIASAFEDDTGVAIEVVRKNLNSIRDEAMQLIPTGEGPDVFIGAHDWSGSMVEAEIVAPLSDLPADTASDFFDPSLTAFTVDGSLYGLPFQAKDGLAVYMNTTLAANAANAAIPTTFDEMKALCDNVLGSGQECLALPGGGAGADAYSMFPFQSAFGGSIFTFDPATGYTADTAGIDEPESILGADFLAGLVEAGYVPSYDYVSAQEAFKRGDALFWMTGPWARNEAETGAAENGFEFQVIPIPAMDGNTPRSFLAARGFYISSQTQSEQAAKTFVYDYMATPEVQQALYQADQQGFPANRTVAEAVSADPFVAAFTASIASGQPTPNVPEMDGHVWDSWGAAMLRIRNGESDPTTALTAAGREIDDLIGA